MASSNKYEIQPDNKGMWWDVALYVPTVVALGTGAAMTWHSGNQNFTYLLSFLTFFFLYQGVHRIAHRLRVLPSSPVTLEVSKQRVLIRQRNGENVELVKDVRYFSDMAGKSFGLTGMDLQGRKRQFVFHRGQFQGDAEFKQVGSYLKVFA